MTKTTAALAAALALLLAVAGTAQAQSPTLYKSQASSICRATSAKLNKIPEPPSIKYLGIFLKAALPHIRAQYNALRKLTPARAQRFLVGKALAAERTQIAGISAWIKELEAGGNPQTTYNKWDKRMSPVSDAEDAAWEKLGIKACANL
jgi:hypothetical protein